MVHVSQGFGSGLLSYFAEELGGEFEHCLY